MKNLFLFAILLNLCLLSLPKSAQAETLEEMFPGMPMLCGSPRLLPSSSEANSLFSLGHETLSDKTPNWIIAIDLATYQDLANLLANADNLLRVCVPISEDRPLIPDQPYFTEWFAYWSLAGSGISVSNQRGNNDPR